MPSAEERAFFDRIRDEPGEDGPRLIYADWLEENGQPDRAEFVRLQVALDRLPDDDPRRPDLRDRERVLRETNEARWTADLAPLVTGWEFRRGVIDSVSVDPAQLLDSGEAIFALAPVRKVRFVAVGDRLAKLVQSPLLRHVRELDLCGNDVGNRGPILLARSKHLARLDALDLSFTDLGDKGLQALADSPVFGTLRSLQIGGNGQVSGNSRLGLPGLRALANSPHLTGLIRLDVSNNNLSDAALRALLDGPNARRLSRLDLHTNRLGDAGTAVLVESLVFTKMAELDRKIDLRRVEMGPAGARALAASQALRAVEELNLDGNHLGDAGLAALAASDNLPRLRALSLRENRIGDDGARALARSRLMATLRDLDLTGNIIKEDSQDRLHEASVEYDWRGLLKLKADSQIRTRPRAFGPQGGFVRRPLP
jgi:uncharacterized protein (TIGR02996 family)